MGVSGSGKTTIGKGFAKAVGWSFEEGDRWHPPANVEKMRAGTPLNDEDRWPWLDALSKAIGEWIATDRPTVLACSALKQVYRDRLSGGRPEVVFAYLKGTSELVGDRVSRRRHEYMPPTLLPSQFATLEEPIDAIPLDIGKSPPRLIEQLRRALGV
ncbi:MAG: gluconokinase [Alphaproteobacteria bacterium]|nr:gluconokinase [Alphaproteobacteria bacterium]